MQRVCELLKRELGLIIVRELSFSSPLITVSAVDLTPDLKQGHVYITALGTNSDRQNALTVLEQNRVMLQAEVAKRVVLKNTPHLYFKLDHSIERGSRILHIMDELGMEREPEQEPDERDEQP